jgi:hypothetical protein
VLSLGWYFPSLKQRTFRSKVSDARKEIIDCGGRAARTAWTFAQVVRKHAQTLIVISEWIGTPKRLKDFWGRKPTFGATMIFEASKPSVGRLGLCPGQ